MDVSTAYLFILHFIKSCSGKNHVALSCLNKCKLSANCLFPSKSKAIAEQNHKARIIHKNDEWTLAFFADAAKNICIYT